MITTTWHSLSVRASMIYSMAVMLLPLLLSAVAGYFILHRTVIADYRDISFRQHTEMVPLHNLQSDIFQSEVSLEEYVVTGNPEKLRDYRLVQQQINVEFSHLAMTLGNESGLAQLLAEARTEWQGLEAIVSDLLAARDVQDQSGTAAALSRFNSKKASAQTKLAATYSLIEDALTADYADASLGFERSEWIAGIAVAVSLLMMMAGIFLINRTLLGSIQRLVDGARLFSEGNRDHRIEVQVPPELKNVADEFNRMIMIIHRSEGDLIDQANRDKLTNLLNRRAYDENMTDAYQRLQRNGEAMALIAMDVDYFKKVNDTYGHDAGDEVLKAVADALMSSVRLIDKVFRTGGEEFSILLPGAEAAAAAVTAERIRREIEAMVVTTPHGTLKITVSMGYAIGLDSSHTPELLKASADKALYQAKSGGRNRAVAADLSIRTRENDSVRGGSNP